MSKADTKTAKNQAQQNIAGIASGGAENKEQLEGALGTAQSTAADVLPFVVGGYSDISTSGGFDPAILGSLRTGYSDMARTGGVSPESRAALSSQASSGVRSVFDTLRSRASRLSTASGGYGNPAALEANIARQGSNAASETMSSFGAKLADMEQRGKIAGLSGLGETERSVALGRLGGLGGLGSVYGQNLSMTSATMGQIIDNYAKQNGLSNEEAALLQRIAMQPGIGTNIMNSIIGLGGAAAGVMTGMGGGSPKPKPQPQTTIV